MHVFFQGLNSLLALGLMIGIIGLFFYKTYQVFQKPSETKRSSWEKIEADVLASRVTQTFRYGTIGLEVDLAYTVNGRRYTGTGETVVYKNQQPPTKVEIVYKKESPEAWEWAEDHFEETTLSSSSRFAILFIWFLLILIGGGIVFAVYFPHRVL